MTLEERIRRETETALTFVRPKNINVPTQSTLYCRCIHDKDLEAQPVCKTIDTTAAIVVPKI